MVVFNAVVFAVHANGGKARRIHGIVADAIIPDQQERIAGVHLNAGVSVATHGAIPDHAAIAGDRIHAKKIAGDGQMIQNDIVPVNFNAVAGPGADDAVAHHNIGAAIADEDAVLRAGKAQQGEAVQIQRDVIGIDVNRIAGTDGDIVGQIIGSRPGNGDEAGGVGDGGARLDLVQRFHGGRGRAGRSECALRESGGETGVEARAEQQGERERQAAKDIFHKMTGWIHLI